MIEKMKLGIFNMLFAFFMILFLASFVEFGILAATNTIPTYEFVVAAQLIGSILLLMFAAAMSIFSDI